VTPTLKSLVRHYLAEITLDLRNALQATKNDLDMEKKRNQDMGDLLQEKTKQCAKIQVADLGTLLI
jgi:hypothetical protein